MCNGQRFYRYANVILISAFLAACAGRTANPAASYRVGDEAMSCQEIKADMAHVQSQVDRLVPESEKTGKNVALGGAGCFKLVPWFFMDLSETEKVEIQAYKERYLSLEKLYSRKDCANDGRNSNAAASIESDQNTKTIMDRKDPEARLSILKSLLDQGLISDEEYQKQRKEVIKGI